MHSKQYLAALAALVPFIVDAAPLTKRSQGSMSISQVASSQKVLKTGAIEYRKALAKYNYPMPHHVNTVALDQQSGSVTATPQQYDTEYLCPVTIGGQDTTLDFDTGSADLWVFSTLQPSSETSGHTLYNPSNAQQMDDTWNISYGDGSGASGTVYADSVTIGGVTATSQAVEAATSVSSSFSSNTADNGLVGLAFSSINTVTPNQQTTFFATVMNTLDQPVFTADLRYQQPGSYDFGQIDGSKYSGDITYVSVDNSQGFWGFSVDSTSYGNGFSGIADTGTTLMLIDDSTVTSYYNSFGASYNNNAGGYSFDCNTTPPDFGLTIGGTSFTVPGQYINFAPNGDGTCYGGIQSNQGQGISILGDVFLKSVFVVFDGGNTQLGFANKA